MNTTFRIWSLVFSVGIAAGLAGCHSSKSEYWLEVRNDSGNMVAAEFVLDDGSTYRPLTEIKRIAPADRVGMGPIKAKTGDIVLFQAETKENPSFPARLPLPPGLSVVNITRGDAGKLNLQLVPRH